jgi:hypothetical protein
MMNPPLERALHRLQIAEHILAELQLMERWRAFGEPVLVGAIAYGLIVAPDIDLEIFCETPRIEDGFAVLKACALHPQVRKARFTNALDGPDMGLYWQLRYLHEDGQEWKIDMWTVARDHPGPLSSALVEPLRQALTDETRQAILEIKEGLLLDPDAQCASIHVYRAVLEDGVHDLAEFRGWLATHPTSGLVAWKPGGKD